MAAKRGGNTQALSVVGSAADVVAGSSLLRKGDPMTTTFVGFQPVVSSGRTHGGQRVGAMGRAGTALWLMVEAANGLWRGLGRAIDGDRGRQRQRMALMAMSDHTLRDIGLTRQGWTD